MLPSWLSLCAFQHALFATLWTFSWNIPAWLCLIFASFVSRSKDTGLCHCMLRLIRPWRKRKNMLHSAFLFWSHFRIFWLSDFLALFCYIDLSGFRSLFIFFSLLGLFRFFEFSGFRLFFTLFVFADFRIFGLPLIFHAFHLFRFSNFRVFAHFSPFRFFHFSNFRVG